MLQHNILKINFSSYFTISNVFLSIISCRFHPIHNLNPKEFNLCNLNFTNRLNKKLKLKIASYKKTTCNRIKLFYVTLLY